jgi:hypothetical protein
MVEASTSSVPQTLPLQTHKILLESKKKERERERDLEVNKTVRVEINVCVETSWL